MGFPTFAVASLAQAALVASVAQAQTVSVSVPSSAPTAAPTLSPSLWSLSLEQDRWTDWAGTSEPNQFLLNVLGNLEERSGQTPWIRIGANSEDRTQFNPALQFSQTVSNAPTAATPYPEAAAVVVGSEYYQIADHLPSGTNVVWGVNLLSDNLTASYLEAQAIHEAFTSSAMQDAGVTLQAIEIGNEPDLYPGKLNYTSANWNVSAYISQWTKLAKNITNAGFVTSGSGPKFFGPSFADVATTGFSPSGVVSGGLFTSKPGKLIKTYSQHHYQCGQGELLTDLVIKANVRSNLTIMEPGISVAQQQGIPYVLGETNSCFDHGAVNASNVAGAAIWALDYVLYGGSLGITRLFFHEGIGFKYNLIQPITLNISTINAAPLNPPLAPHVQPPYYGALVAAEAIGTSGHTTVTELSINDASVSGFAFYEKGVLKRAVLIDHTMFFSGSGATRTSKTISLSVSGTVQVKRLFIPSADATTGLVWGGQSFDTSTGLASGSVVTQSTSANNITLSETEIVLVTF